jgi:hypothetical protein
MTVPVNHDYPTPGALKAVDAQNEPLEDVVIRIFNMTEFNASTGTPVAETITDANGEWLATLPLADSRTWIIHFQKTGYGPVHEEITT